MFCTPAEQSPWGSVLKLLMAHSSPSPTSHPPAMGTISANPPEHTSPPGQVPPPGVKRPWGTPERREGRRPENLLRNDKPFGSADCGIGFVFNPSKIDRSGCPAELITVDDAKS